MPIRSTIWKVADSPTQLAPSRLSSEKRLEELIVGDSRILSNEWMLIGQQEVTSHGSRTDLLAIAPDGSLVLIELKRDRTPRDIVAQALDYASWVETLEAEKIAAIYHRFSNGGNLAKAFRERFGTELDEDSMNESHQIIIVASELDEGTERIIGYLNERDVAINAVFFQVFQNGEEQFLSRAWLIDPGETQANVVTSARTKGAREPWNGEFYVSFGDPKWRSWDDARKYGFISAGGGSWYSQTLKLLSPGDRVWVNIPRTGYVGVGRVKDTVQPAKDFVVQTPSGTRPALDVLKHGDDYRQNADDPEKSEYFVSVEWLESVSDAKAVNELGLFGNQNTVCRPATPQWRHTVERLKSYFTKWDDA
jgi:hypothetical protein